MLKDVGIETNIRNMGDVIRNARDAQAIAKEAAADAKRGRGDGGGGGGGGAKE